MPTQTATGVYNISTGQNTSGSPVTINSLGQIIYANFFNAGGINAQPNRTYLSQVSCTTGADGCPVFTFTTDVGNTPQSPPLFAVRGYPEIILAGSKWGVPGETIQASFGASQTSSTGTEYVDSDYAQANTGYPTFANSIPATTVCFNADEINHVGSERDVMMESWFYDVCQNTGQGNELIGDLDNNYGTQGQTNQHNNQLLEVMVHIGPINFQSNAYNDSSNGQRNPAQFYCSGPHTIGGQDYEIWYGRNGQQNISLSGTTQNGQSSPSGALVVYNRLGPVGGPYGTDLTNEGDITLDWSGILNHARTQLQNELIACNAWGNGQANSAWTNPSSPDNPFSRMNDPACGAVGGIEFGTEPQLNGPADEPVILQVNKLDVEVAGLGHIGPTPESCLVVDGCTPCGDFSLIAPGSVVVGNTYNLSVSPSVASIRVLAGGQLVRSINGTSGSWAPTQADCALAGSQGFTIVVQESVDCPQCTLMTGIQCTTGNSGDDCPDCTSYQVTGLPSDCQVAVGDVFQVDVSPDLDGIRVFAGPCLVYATSGTSFELEITQEICDVAEEVSGGQITLVGLKTGCSACPLKILFCSEEGCPLCSEWSTDLQNIQTGNNSFTISPPAGESIFIWYITDSSGIIRAVGNQTSTAFTFTEADCDFGPFDLFAVSGNCDPCLLKSNLTCSGECLPCSELTASITGLTADGILVEGQSYTVTAPSGVSSIQLNNTATGLPILQSNSNSLVINVNQSLCEQLVNGATLVVQQDGCTPCARTIFCVPDDEPVTGSNPMTNRFSCCIGVQDMNRERIRNF